MSINLLRTCAGALAAACCLAVSAPTSALMNGGFDSGLTGWTVIGDVSVQSGQALITNAVDGDDTSGNLNASGTPPELVGLDPGLETKLGLAIGALDGLLAPELPYEGSGIAQTFTAAAGTRVTFEWRFLTNEDEDEDEDANADFAFVALDGAVTLLADSLGSSLSSGGGPFDFETGLATYVSGVLSEGSHTLVVGVVDVNDATVSSGLLVDNAAVVPLPAAAWLLGAALTGLVGFARRRRV
jgi:hypothetical protein